MPKTLEQSRHICLIINLSIMEVQELTLQEMAEVNGGLLGLLGSSCKDRCCDDDCCDDGLDINIKLKLSIGICL